MSDSSNFNYHFTEKKTTYQPSPTMKTVAIKRLRDDVEIPKYETPGAAGFDLAIADDLIFGPSDKDVGLVPTGLVIATPPGHMLYITFRSSTPRKWGVTVLTGIVDSDYCGEEDELKIQVQRMSSATVFIPAGTRIAQGIIVPVHQVGFREVDEMGKSRGGFGSTG